MEPGTRLAVEEGARTKNRGGPSMSVTWKKQNHQSMASNAPSVKNNFRESINNNCASVKSRRSQQDKTGRTNKTNKSQKSLSTWGVIRGFDNAVAKMNACFSNMLYELQKDEIKKKEEEERKRL